MAEHDHSHDWRPVPILPSRDAAVTAEFWQRLGFRVVNAMPDGDPYLIAVRDGAELHFAHLPDVDPATNQAACYIHVSDVDAVHAEWAALGLPSEGPGSLGAPTQMPWGLREAWLTDPDGTVVHMGSST